MKFTDDYRKKHEARKLQIAASHSGDSADEAWHTRRLFGLGGSEMGIILGVNHYQTIDELWRLKTGRAQKSEGNQKTHWGHVLEDVVAKEFANATCFKVQKCNKHFCSDELPFIVGNIDRFVYKCSDSGRWERYAILECKTAGAFVSKNFSRDGAWYIDEKFVDANASGITKPTDIPMSYYLQCQHYMYVTGVHRCFLAVLIGGNDYRIYVVNYRADEIAFILDRACDFWCHNVLDDVEPELTAKDLVNPIFEHSGETKIIGSVDPIFKVFEELQQVTAEIKALEEREQGLREQVVAAVGQATEMTDCSGTKLCTLKTEFRAKWDESSMKSNIEDYQTYLRLKEKYYVKSANKSRTLRIL